jgi:KDO2-lipid IV(A) lauroyltransferase
VLSAPTSGRSRWRAASRFDGSFWRKCAYLGCVYGPEWWKRYSPGPIAAIIFMLVGRNRRGAMANLKVVLGDTDRTHLILPALKTFAEFAHCFVEATEYYSPRRKPVRFDVSVDNSLANAIRDGRGAVLVTAHLGNWDIAAKGLRDYGARVNLVMARETNASIQEYVRDLKEDAGVRVIYSDTSVFSSFNMIRALRNNEIVAIQLDRPVGAGGMRPVSFFGRSAMFPSGPFVLARLAGAPIIPVFAPRLGVRHYAVRVGRRHDVPRDGRDPAALQRIMRAVVAEFEAVVRAYPTQWFQFSPFWKEEGSSSAEGAPRHDEHLIEQRQAGGQ